MNLPALSNNCLSTMRVSGVRPCRDTLKENKMDEYYYYLRDKQRKPIVTVCLLKDNKGTISRGVAICSKQDNPVKKFGRRLAKERAVWAAAFKNTFGEPVFRWDVMEHLRDISESCLWKSQYDIEIIGQLTEFEKRIVYREEANA